MSPTYRVIILPKAGKDIVSIHDYISQSSPSAASKVIEGVMEAMESLKSIPHRTLVWPQVPSKLPPVRSLPVGSYVIFFRVFDPQKDVRVVRVAHGARRPIKRFP